MFVAIVHMLCFQVPSSPQ